MSAGEEEVLPRDFGKYRLTKRIATGGMAEIFLAHRHDAPLEPLVIKRILPHLTQTEGFVSMFLDEARIAAGLDHSNIVRIEDIGQLEGSYFLAMEYIHGEDIRCIYNKAYKLQRSLPLSHSIQVVADAARGLAHAHRATDLAGKPMDLVHRDVSPQNILVTYDGHVKVVDFGIAKAANKVAQTRAGVLKGKYSYMSPEQAMGEPIDHRTDLFALGIILYETTTGTRLFKRGSELSTLQAIIKCELTPPSEALPGYPAELERIVLQTLAKARQERYQDGERLADDLERFLTESGLATTRETIAGFMADLFRDKLDEEEGTGEPAVPDPEVLREEIAAAPEPREPGPQARLATELATRKRIPVPESVASPGFAEGSDHGDLDATRAERSGELPRIAVPAHSVTAGGPSGGNDDAATVAVAAAYRAPEPTSGSTEPPAAPDGAPARRLAEPTERIRMREAGAAAASVRPGPSAFDEPPNHRSGPSPLVLAGLGAILLGLALGLGAVLLRRPAVTPARLEAEVTVLTEPGAEVLVDGDPLGTAGPQGRAGPFTLAPGPRIVRVVHDDLRFERQRSVEVEAGRAYETEIRARRGFLKLRVAPWARVTIDGKPMGLTPLPRIPLYEGVHEVALENPDLDARKVVTARVLPNEEAVVEVRFAPR